MTYSFEVTESEFGFIATFSGDDKALSGVGETAFAAIEHLAGFLDNMQAVRNRPQDYMGAKDDTL